MTFPARAEASANGLPPSKNDLLYDDVSISEHALDDEYMSYPPIGSSSAHGRPVSGFS